MKPSLRQLEYLVAIAECGTFSEAAKRTFVAQPSLSAQVKDMELFLGAPLFERGRRGALLTPIGEQLVGRARIILRDVETLRTLARQSADSVNGRIKIGVLSSVGPYLMPLAARNLHAAYPDLRLIVREETAENLQQQLIDGTFDVIISVPSANPLLTGMPIAREDLYICTALDDALASDTGPVTLKELRGRELLSLGAGHSLTHTIKLIAEEARAGMSVDYAGTSLDAIRQMSVMGETISILPSLYAISEAIKDPALIVRRIHHKLARRDIALTWRAASPLEETFQKIGDVFTQAAADVMG